MNASRPIGQRELTQRQIELLGMLRFEGRWAFFTGPQISDWKALSSVLDALGGTWTRKRQGFWWRDGFDPSELVAAALENGSIIDPKAADFFATPSLLARSTVRRADIRPGHLVLEPSAGDGALVRAIRRLHQDSVAVICVEALEQRRAVLEAISDAVRIGDFLTESFGKAFDRIVMNPPFSDGQDVDHVTHALGLLKADGLLVAIMSAGVEFRQDKRYTRFRELVTERGGTIERNPEGSFKASGTDVRTVTVVIPGPAYVAPEPSDDEEDEPVEVEAEVEDAPEPEPPPDDPPPSKPGTDLAGRLSIKQLVETYERAECDIRHAFELIGNAEASLTNVFADSNTGGSIYIRGRAGNSANVTWSDPDEHLEIIRRQVWHSLVARLDLQRIMSPRAWDELWRKINDTDPPPITVEHVTQLVEQFRNDLPKLLNENIQAVFEWLRPHKSHYKSNSEFEVPRKVVLSWCVERYSSLGRWHLGDSTGRYLTALENVFSALDGKGLHKGGYTPIETAIREIPAGAPCVGETGYFRFRGFANRNLHITFKRLDLLAKFNAKAGGNRLRGERKARA